MSGSPRGQRPAPRARRATRWRFLPAAAGALALVAISGLALRAGAGRVADAEAVRLANRTAIVADLAPKAAVTQQAAEFASLVDLAGFSAGAPEATATA